MAVTDFLLTSDYPIDQIVGSRTGSISQATGNSTTTIAHGLSFTPLVIAKWSLNSNFSTSYDEIGVSVLNNATLKVQSDATNLYLITGNNNPSAITIYYRLLYFLPPGSNATVTATTAALDKFFLNTGYNYTKIIKEGTLPGGIQVVTHSLGYYPQAEVWYTRSSDGRTVHLIENEVVTPTSLPSCQMTTTGMTLADNTITPVSAWYYRIYADEA